MTAILDQIIEKKREEVKELLNKKIFRNAFEPVSSFQESAAQSNTMNIIAEIKRASPSKGIINRHVDPVKQAKQYEKLGAKAISVLTDRTFFNGSMEDLRNVRRAVNLPLLCKDFIIHPVQIDHAKAAGANIVLLIVAALPDSSLHELYHYAKGLGLEVLVEVHSEEELARALELNPELIGINNRNLQTFEVDLAVTERLAKKLPEREVFFISESGMTDEKDVLRVRDAGAKGILVGETLMKAENLAETFKKFQVPLCLEGEPSC